MSISAFEMWFLKKQFSSKMRFSIFKKLIRFLASDVSLSQALDIMYIHASDDGKKPKNVQAIVIDQWRRNIRNGQDFSRAITGWAPDKERIVIEAGENAGRLDMAIQNAIFIHEGSAQIKKAIIGGLAYPVFLVIMALGFMGLFGIEVIPAFAEVLPREQWTGAGAQMATMSDFVQDGLLQTVVGFLGLVVVFFIALPRWKGKIRSKFDKYPPWSFYKLSMGSGFLLGVSAMHRAGIPLSKALLILSRDAPPWYKEKIESTLRHVRNGQNLGEALYRTGFNFPTKETVLDLRAYAELDGFDEVLDEMGKTWMEESVSSIKGQAAILRNVGLLVLGGVFMWLAMGIFSLQGQVQSGAGM